MLTSAQTTGFVERCGIKLIDSLVYHPQSNSVERWHSAMKRVLQALIYEHKCEWEACVPAMLFALCSVKPKKCQLGRGEVRYLGHVVGQGQRRPDKLKVEKNSHDPSNKQAFGPSSI